MSPEDLSQRLRALVGVDAEETLARDPVNQPMIRHWCDAVDDRNPVYTNPEFAKASVHGGVVAPPTMLQAWTMPGLAGVDVCRALRDDPRFDGMRIVMLTARSQADDRDTAREMGADDYITKPFSPIQLLEKVRDVLGPEALL